MSDLPFHLPDYFELRGNIYRYPRYCHKCGKELQVDLEDNKEYFDMCTGEPRVMVYMSCPEKGHLTIQGTLIQDPEIAYGLSPMFAVSNGVKAYIAMLWESTT